MAKKKRAGKPNASGATPSAPRRAPKVWIPSVRLAHAEKLPPDFVHAVAGLEKELGLTIVLLVQQGLPAAGRALPLETLDPSLVRQMCRYARSLAGKQIGLLIESPGGYAREAYLIARLLQRHCGEFTAIVPQYAKSAATLLVLGASRTLMHADAELGPIDAQVEDPDRERTASALDEVQSLERLHAQALNLLDSTMMLLMGRTKKRTDVLLPFVLRYVSDTMRPLFEKIDTVHFTGMSRTLKVAEAYAVRLLSRRHEGVEANQIAEKLVYSYPDHSFVIDYAEARSIGLEVELMEGNVAALADRLRLHLDDFTAIGSIIEAPSP